MSIEKKSEQQPFSSSVTTTAKLPVWPAVGGATRRLNYNGSNLACALYYSNLKYQTLVQSFFFFFFFCCLKVICRPGRVHLNCSVLAPTSYFIPWKRFICRSKMIFFLSSSQNAFGSARTLCRGNIWSESCPNLVRVVLLCWWSSYI